MRKSKAVKIVLLSLISVLIVYYLFSILFTRNGQFVNYYFPAQFSIESSIENKNFIREINPDKITIVDTVGYERIKDELEIYLCEAFYYRHFGIFNLFSHRLDFDNSICLNVNFVGKDLLFIRYDDGRLKKMRSSNSYWNIFDLGSNVKVSILEKDEREIFSMQFLNLSK